MPYYKCPRIGTGTIDDPFRAQLPRGINHAATELKDGSFIVHSDEELDAPILTDDEAHKLIKKQNRHSNVECTRIHNA